MRRLALAFFLECSATAFADASPLLVDVPALAHASQPAVEQILGKPEFCRKSKLGLSCRYATRGVEIVFVKDKAERITINEMDDTLFDKSAISRLGFGDQQPDESSEEIMRWQHVSGVAEIALHSNKDRIDYAVVVLTPLGDKQK